MTGAPTARRARWGTPQAAVSAVAPSHVLTHTAAVTRNATPSTATTRAKAHGVAHIGVVVPQIVGIVIRQPPVHKLPNSLLETPLSQLFGKISLSAERINLSDPTRKCAVSSSLSYTALAGNTSS